MEGRKARNARSPLTQEPDPQTQPDTTEEDEGGKGELEAVTAAAGDGNSGNNGVINVKLSDIVERAPTPDVPASNPRPVYSTLVAAAGVPNYEAGQRLETMLDVAKAFEARPTATAPWPSPPEPVASTRPTRWPSWSGSIRLSSAWKATPPTTPSCSRSPTEPGRADPAPFRGAAAQGD